LIIDMAILVFGKFFYFFLIANQQAFGQNFKLPLAILILCCKYNQTLDS